MTNPFDELADEHRVIEKVLAALEAAATVNVPLDFYDRAVDFAAKYADAYHHAKEEELLFKYLEERGMPRDYGPLDVIVSEHDAGGHHIDAMRELIGTGDVEGLKAEAHAYVALMRNHIREEDEVLFPMGRALLTPEECEEVHQTFAKVPEPRPSCATYVERAEALLAEVTKRA